MAKKKKKKISNGVKIIYLGSGEFGIECLNALAKSSHSLAFIVTQPQHPAGRGRKPKATPVAHWAKTNSTPFIETDDINTPQVIEKIASLKPDLIVVIAFGQKIGTGVDKSAAQRRYKCPRLVTAEIPRSRPNKLGDNQWRNRNRHQHNHLS